MTHPNLYLDAIEAVLAWDLPDEALTDAATEQARLMAGLDPEDEVVSD